LFELVVDLLFDVLVDLVVELVHELIVDLVVELVVELVVDLNAMRFGARLCDYSLVCYVVSTQRLYSTHLH
jgi:hypothetical protein